MGNVMERLFVDPEVLPQDGYGFIQMLFLGAVYGHILLHASNMISDSSELLLLTKWAPLVGPVVLPVLGAVPDGAVIMFSGSNQRDLAVGVGALAGSTIMLLTVPWALATVSGRVFMDPVTQKLNYKGRPRALPGPWYSQLFNHACSVDVTIRRMGYFMLLSSLSYVVIQGPAFRWGCAEYGCGCVSSNGTADEACLRDVAEGEKGWALAGFCMASALFVYYLWGQYRDTVTAEHLRVSKVKDVTQRLLQAGLVDLYNICNRIPELGQVKDQKSVMESIIRENFNSFDRDKNGFIDQAEFLVLVDRLSGDGTADLLREFRLKTKDDGKVDYGEFEEVLGKWMNGDIERDLQRRAPSQAAPAFAGQSDDDDDDDEDEPEIPEEVAACDTEEEKMAKIWSLALTGMLGGTGLVLLFADPMVGILGAIGKRTGIPAFYVSFVLAPLASNASELVAAMNYAAKKTRGTFTISLENLLGAACMNNTFCLAIFLSQVYLNRLIWEYSAETLSILIVELLMFFFAQRTLHPTWQAPVILLLFPLSLALVYVLERVVGLD